MSNNEKPVAIYTDVEPVSCNRWMLIKAIEFVNIRFNGKTDLLGKPLVIHSLAVMGMLIHQKDISDNHLVVATLHDILEDSDTSYDELRKEFGDKVSWSIFCLTHPKNEPYVNYIKRIIENDDIAPIVKRADLYHNMSRMSGLPEADIRRMSKKYSMAWKMLGGDLKEIEMFLME